MHCAVLLKKQTHLEYLAILQLQLLTQARCALCGKVDKVPNDWISQRACISTQDTTSSKSGTALLFLKLVKAVVKLRYIQTQMIVM